MCKDKVKKGPAKCMACIMGDPKIMTKTAEFCVLKWVKWVCKVPPSDHSYDHLSKSYGKHDALYQGKTAPADQPKHVPIPTVPAMVASMILPICSLDDNGGVPDRVKTAMRKLHRFH